MATVMAARQLFISHRVSESQEAKADLEVKIAGGGPSLHTCIMDQSLSAFKSEFFEKAALTVNSGVKVMSN
jgi:hypothetical protein